MSTTLHNSENSTFTLSGKDMIINFCDQTFEAKNVFVESINTNYLPRYMDNIILPSDVGVEIVLRAHGLIPYNLVKGKSSNKKACDMTVRELLEVIALKVKEEND